MNTTIRFLVVYFKLVHIVVNQEIILCAPSFHKLLDCKPLEHMQGADEMDEVECLQVHASHNLLASSLSNTS